MVRPSRSIHDSYIHALYTSLDLGFVRVFRAYHVYQLYRNSPAVLDPLATPDWTLYYRNATCCPPAPSPPPVTPARVFGPGSCPAIRYDKRSGYWYAGLVPPGALAAGAGYRVRSGSKRGSPVACTPVGCPTPPLPWHPRAGRAAPARMGSLPRRRSRDTAVAAMASRTLTGVYCAMRCCCAVLLCGVAAVPGPQAHALDPQPDRAWRGLPHLADLRRAVQDPRDRELGALAAQPRDHGRRTCMHACMHACNGLDISLAHFRSRLYVPSWRVSRAHCDVRCRVAVLVGGWANFG